MGKPKRRQQVSIPKTKDELFSDSNADSDDSWVVVKKQRVIIHIPALPQARNPSITKPKQDDLQDLTVKVGNTKSTNPVEVPNRLPSVDELEKVASVATNIGPGKQTSASLKPLRVNVQKESGNSGRSQAMKSHNMLPISNISKPIKRPLLVQNQGRLLDGRVLLNQSLRALLIEKKLQKAGGLSRWLASIGLGQFVKIFGGKMGKFQLVNLTMEKLKDMGADPVGPRRKLMHAIDCICQPYCFEAT